MIILLGLIILFSSLPGAVKAADPGSQGYIEGYLKKISVTPLKVPVSTEQKTTKTQTPPVASQTTVLIADYDGNLFEFELSPLAGLLIDQRPARVQDFRPGLEVYGVIQNGMLVSLEGYSVAQPGYLTPGTQTVQGTVKSINRNIIELVQSNGQLVALTTTPATLLQKNGLNLNLNLLYPGDRVKCFLDGLYSNIIARMELEGDAVLIKNVYRGTLQAADRSDDYITLTNTKYLVNGAWQDLQGVTRIPYNSRIPVYVKNQRIPNQNLKYYRDKEVYVAVASRWGRDYIEKMIIKADYEFAYIDRIDQINYGARMFSLLNYKQNIAFHEGTIIVRNGRLVDYDTTGQWKNLNPSSDVLVAAEGANGTQSAMLVAVLNEDINHSNIGNHLIYYGELDQIRQYDLDLKNAQYLQGEINGGAAGNNWQSANSTNAVQNLLWNRDTSIYDADSGQLLSAEQFIASNYRGWYAHLYTDGNIILAMVVKKQPSAQQERYLGTIGQLSSNAITGSGLVMQNSSMWLANSLHWAHSLGNTSLFALQDALIIKENHRITVDDLKAGDRLYVVRENNPGSTSYGQALVVLVK